MTCAIESNPNMTLSLRRSPTGMKVWVCVWLAKNRLTCFQPWEVTFSTGVVWRIVGFSAFFHLLPVQSSGNRGVGSGEGVGFSRRE